MSNKTSPCEKCHKRFRVLEKGLCFNCYVDKFKTIPTMGVYKQDKEEKKKNV